jgi:peptidoglycan-N-acetylglucosamine deacetylase
MMRRGLLLVTAVLAVSAPRVGAKGWPHPAAGRSHSGDPEVVFTFDDGPNPPTSGKVLEILAAHHVHAIFFMTGWHLETGTPAQSLRVLQRVVRDGHVIGNHTQTHAKLCAIADDRKRRWEVEHTRALLERDAGMPVLWFRTPYGSHCNRVLALLEELHLEHFHWDIDPQEWKHHDPELVARSIIRHIDQLRDDERAVVLMHDTKIATVKALPEILDWIDAENARRVTSGRRPIQVVSGSELAMEQTAPGLLAWMHGAARASADGVAGDLEATLP